LPRSAISPLGLTTEGSTKFKPKGWKCYLKKLQCTCFGSYQVELIDRAHKKGFVIPTKSFVKIGIAKIFFYDKMFSSINKAFGCCSEFLAAATKNVFVVPNFVAVTKRFFFCV